MVLPAAIGQSVVCSSEVMHLLESENGDADGVAKRAVPVLLLQKFREAKFLWNAFFNI